MSEAIWAGLLDGGGLEAGQQLAFECWRNAGIDRASQPINRSEPAKAR